MSDFLSTGVQRLGVVDERVSSEGLDSLVTDDISVELKKGWEEKKGGKAVGESSISKLLQFPCLVLTLVVTIARLRRAVYDQVLIALVWAGLLFRCLTPSESFMRHQCPTCARRFPSSCALLVHLNRRAPNCRRIFSDHGAVGSYLDELRQQRRTEVHELMANLTQRPPVSVSSTPSPKQDPRQSYIYEYHPNMPVIYGRAESFMDRIIASNHCRASNPYYPFNDEAEWNLARFLVRSSLTQTEIDKALKLNLVGFIHPLPLTSC